MRLVPQRCSHFMIEVQIEIPGNLNAHCSIRPWFYKAERLQSAILEDRPFKDLGVFWPQPAQESRRKEVTTKDRRYIEKCKKRSYNIAFRMLETATEDLPT